eukprot:scaffold7849_cov23-Prasinocladus_malaysianus.AAC.1
MFKAQPKCEASPITHGHRPRIEHHAGMPSSGLKAGSSCNHRDVSGASSRRPYSRNPGHGFALVFKVHVHRS